MILLYSVVDNSFPPTRRFVIYFLFDKPTRSSSLVQYYVIVDSITLPDSTSPFMMTESHDKVPVVDWTMCAVTDTMEEGGDFHHVHKTDPLWGKRQRDETSLFSFAPISQDDDDVSMNTSPVKKRSRPSCHDINLALSHDTVNLSSDSICSNSREKQPWWRRTPKPKNCSPTPILCDNDSVCFVCESIFTPRFLFQESMDVMPANSLLAYFPQKISSTAYRTKILPEMSRHRVETCNFCERAACPSCMKQCEGCKQVFCTFCSTSDYSFGSYARTVCIDCCPVAEQTYTREP